MIICAACFYTTPSCMYFQQAGDECSRYKFAELSLPEFQNFEQLYQNLKVFRTAKKRPNLIDAKAASFFSPLFEQPF